MKISGPIILVDDDQDDHDIFITVCENLGVCQHLKHFNNAIEFLSFFETTTEKPFIILCDINMPRMDGLQLRAVINENETLRRKSVPFIFFSTVATEAQVRKAYDLTVQGFFVKGNSIKEIQDKFRLILEYWSDCRHPNTK